MSKPPELEINELLEWLEGKDEVCFVLYPKEGRVVRFGSVQELVREYLSQQSMMAICEPLYNVQSDRTRELAKWNEEGRPLGRPPSTERHYARMLLNRGLDYKGALLILKMTASLDLSARPAESGGRRRTMTQRKARRIRTALDREWKDQRGEDPPTPSRGWWKD